MESCKFLQVLFLFLSVALFSGCTHKGGGEETAASTTLFIEAEPASSSTTTSSTTTSTTTTTLETTSTSSTTSSTIPFVLSGNVTVLIINRSFVPQNITVAVGTVVTWINNDSSEHQIISDLDFAGSKGGFTRQLNELNSKRLYKGAVYRYRFQRTGTFGYHCNIYPAIRGSVTVVG